MTSEIWSLIAQLGLLGIKYFISDSASAAAYQKSWEDWILWQQNRTVLSAETKTAYEKELAELRAKHLAAEQAANNPAIKPVVKS